VVQFFKIKLRRCGVCYLCSPEEAADYAPSWQPFVSDDRSAQKPKPLESS